MTELRTLGMYSFFNLSRWEVDDRKNRKWHRLVVTMAFSGSGRCCRLPLERTLLDVIVIFGVLNLFNVDLAVFPPSDDPRLLFIEPQTINTRVAEEIETHTKSVEIPLYNGLQPDFDRSPTQSQIDQRVVSSEDNLPSAVTEHCNLAGADYWMVPESDWRRRSPAFLILGEKKSGTTGLFQTLTLHPNIIRGRKKELIFFNPEWFQFWEDEQIGGRVNVARARKSLFSMFPLHALQQRTSLITGEATPEYLVSLSNQQRPVISNIERKLISFHEAVS